MTRVAGPRDRRGALMSSIVDSVSANALSTNVEQITKQPVDANANVAPVSSTIDASLDSGCEISIGKKAPPAFITASMLTTAQLDFSKSRGTMLSGPTPSTARRQTRQDDRESSSP